MKPMGRQEGSFPLSVRNYLGTLRLVLDFADLDPNPARDRRVKLPRPEENVPNPPRPQKWRRSSRTLLVAGGWRSASSSRPE
jgi:hypothetical protein